jgi:hypothetical protein
MPTVQSQLFKLALRLDPHTKRGQAFQDSSAATTITGIVTNGGLLRVTAASHGLQTDDQVYIKSVVWNPTSPNPANNIATIPNWSVTKIDANTVDLQGSTFSGTGYTSGGTMVGALIGSVDGSFSRQRLLDIYNEARIVLAGFIAQQLGVKSAVESIDGNIVKTDLTFSAGVATKPTGFIKEVLLRDPSGNTVSIVNNIDLPSVQKYDSASTKFVYRTGSQFKAQSTTYITDSAAYVLHYYGLTDFTLDQVLAGTVTETFNDDWAPRVLELAVAVATEHGNVDPLALAVKLFGGMK